MGSNNPPEEFTVLVTGFGPFKKDYPINPSWEIAKNLPEYLPPPTKSTDGWPAQKLPPVRILIHPEPIRVNYQVVRALVPKLWGSTASPDDGEEPEPEPPTDDSGDSNQQYAHRALGRPPQKIDVAVHIGMAGPALQWSLEHRAHRDGYAMKDVDGEFLRDQERRLRQGERWVWHGAPPELFTDVDVHDVFARWREYVPQDDAFTRNRLHISEDPGRFLCDFIYFSSLAHLYKSGERRRVVFLHVPCSNFDKDIEQSRQVALGLIRAVVESELARVGKLPGAEGEGKPFRV